MNEVPRCHRQTQSNDIEDHQQRNRQHSSQYGKCNKHALVGKKSKHSAHLLWNKNRLLRTCQLCRHDTQANGQLTGAYKQMASEKCLIIRRTAPSSICVETIGQEQVAWNSRLFPCLFSSGEGRVGGGSRDRCFMAGSASSGSAVHQAAFKPVTCASIHCRSDDVGWKAIHRGPGRAAIRSIGWETRRFDWPVILALQGPDDRGKRHSATQRFGAGLVDVGKQDREHGPACSPWARKNGGLGRHANILAGSAASRQTGMAARCEAQHRYVSASPWQGPCCSTTP